MPRRLLLVPVLVCALGLAACGSSKAASTTTSTTARTAAASAPSVANATNLSTEPTVGPGKQPPPTKLVTKDLVVGKGPSATSADTVTVQYVGAAYDTGKVFDASWTNGQPSTFPLNEVVAGFREGIVGMKVGGRRVIVIPPSLGYGKEGRAPAISPNETLTFVVDLKAL
jgi:peptidylprolyl isomerase